MLAHEKARELASILIKSEEYQEYLKAKSILEQDRKNVDLLQEFRKKYLELTMAHYADEDVENDYLEHTDNLFDILSKNATVNEYLNAEYRLSRLMGDIQQIIGEAVSDWAPTERKRANLN